MADLADIARWASDEARRCGADFADATAGTSRVVDVDAEKNGIHDAKELRRNSLSVRAIVRGAMAFAMGTSHDPASVRETAQRAVAAAKLAEPDPDFVALPGPADYPAVGGLWDDRIAGMSVGELIAALGRGIDEARAVVGDAVVEGGASFSVSESATANTLGIVAGEQRTSIGSSFQCVVRRGDDVGSFWDFDRAHTLAEYAPDGIGEKAAREAVRYLGARTMESAVLPVVLGPLPSGSLFGSIVSAAAADHIQRKRSYLVGKRGERIAPEFLTLVDDGLIPGGLGSGAWDDEGAPRRKVAIVENGVLARWLHGSYTANKAGEENTGHGTRNRGVSPTNVIPALGTMTAEDILRDTGEGIYLSLGSLSPPLSSGDISATIDFGWKIEGGALAYPLRNAMIGIGIFELLERLDAVSSDYRAEPGQVLPTIRIRDVRIAGGR